MIYLICDLCHHQNDPGALLCFKCGSHEMRPESAEQRLERVASDPVTYAGEAAELIVEMLERAKAAREGGE